MALSPLNRRRLANFRANRRGWWSLWIFTALSVVTLFAEFIANDRPLVARVDGRLFVPVLAGADIRPVALMLAIFLSISGLVGFLFMPNTAGKSLEEIERERGRRPVEA